MAFSTNGGGYRSGRRSRNAIADINVTPFVDVVLVLIKVAEATLGRAICSTSSAAGRTARSGPRRRSRWPQTDKEHLAASAYRRYQNALKAAGAVDFDDLLLLHRGAFRAVSRSPRGRGRPLRSSAGRRVPGHQRQPVPHRQGPGRRASQPVRGGRRRPVDLRLAGRRGRAHPATSPTTGPRPRSSAWKTTIARRARSSPGRTG